MATQLKPTDGAAVLAADSTQATQPVAVRPVSRYASSMRATEDILYGSVAGIVGKYIEYPFDTVKVRLQTQPGHLPLRYHGPLDCFRQSIRADGVLDLYRGISAPLVGAALETSSLFLFERLGRATIVSAGFSAHNEPLSLPALYFSGAFSGVLTSFVLTPIELVKCNIQVTGDATPPRCEVVAATPRRPLAVVRMVYRHEGLRGFWRGQTGTLVREAGGSAAWFGSKETTTRLLRAYNVRQANKSGDASPAQVEHLRSDPLPLWQQALAGASAGMSYSFLFYPADTVKSRMQTSPLSAYATSTTPATTSHAHPTFWNEVCVLWKQSGLRGFYRGCGITVARSAPSSAFIFMVFDGLKAYLPLT